MHPARFFLFSLLTWLCFSPFLGAQALVEGYVYETGNRGYLNQVKVAIRQGDQLIKTAITEADGHFTVNLPAGAYEVVCTKDVFAEKVQAFTVADDKVFLKIEMKRRPGYLFDVTLAEKRTDESQVVDAISDARIEIYNRTAQKPELVLENHPNAFFQFTFEQGNHYTILIRKTGFLAKRIEAYVNVKGCIICVDGVKQLTPGITDNLTEGNTMGTLLANIELERAALNKRISFENIYYDFNQHTIRPDAAKELDKIVALLRDNPNLTVELGSHTDARGNNEDNRALSQRRAESAVHYIVGQGIDKSRISAKGYGETQLANKCRDGVTCSEVEHQKNRRTELRITGLAAAETEMRSLEELARAEAFEQSLRNLEGQTEYRVDTPQKAATVAPPPTVNKPAASNKSPTESTKMAENQQVKTLPPSAPPKPIEEPAKTIEKEKNSAVLPPSPPLRTTQPLPAQVTGYLVEFVRVDNALPEGNALFNTFKGPIYKQLDPQGKFCYYTGLFQNIEDAKEYWRGGVLPKFPQAKLVEFYKGEKIYLR